MIERGVLDTLPGLSGRLAEALRGEIELPTAAPRLRDLDEVGLRTGTAWSDPGFATALRTEHERLGAGPRSRANVDALRDGAACVITGQQPGLGLGPLYSFYKILGTVVLARELTARHGRPVVPVFWCGADDSDFDEVRRAWAWEPGRGAFRAELPKRMWRAGQRVGDVEGPEIDRVERALAARARIPVPDGLVGTSLADRARAWALHLFAEDGLVVVDARDERLRALGRPLFERYARDARTITEVLERHTRSLVDDGWPEVIDARARESGLFTVQGDVRRKLPPDELAAGTYDATTLAPSVLLRPVWQDALLAPLAAVLGPSELGYHVQIAPVYRALDVEAARPVSRPHVVVVDDDLPWPDDPAQRAAWIAGSDATLASARRAWLPDAWDAEVEALELAVHEGLTSMRSRVPVADEIERARGRIDAELGRLRDRLADARAAREGVDARRAREWYEVRGVPQERAYCAPQWYAWWKDAAPAAREAVVTAYVDAVDAGRPTAWWLRGPAGSRRGT